MEVTVENAGPCRKVMHVNAPADVVAPGYSEVVTDFANVAKVPGFRHGKAPAKVIEKRFSDKIAEEAKERLVPEFYRKALEKEGIVPIAIVSVENVSFKKEVGLAFNVTIDVAPEFKLPKYKKITIRESSVDVTDQQVDDTITRVREQFGRFEDVTGRAARQGDLLKVDYTGTCDSRPVADIASGDAALGSGEDFMVFLGDPEFLPGIAAGLEGVGMGETRELAVEFPDDFRVKELAGRRADYSFKVKDIQERIVPELNETHFSQLDVDSMDTLRVKVREELLDSALEREKSNQRAQIARFLIDKTQFEIPQSVVEEETKLAVRGIVQDIARRGATQEQIAEQRDSIVSTATHSSTERVKLSYILSRVAEQEGIETEDSAVDKRIEVMAERYRMTPEALREELNKRNGLVGLRSEMRAEKAMEFLHAHAKIKR
jgi:trigger factor